MVLPLMVVIGCGPEVRPAGRAVLQAGKGAQHFEAVGDGIAQNARPLSEAASDLSAAPPPTPGRYSPQVRRALVAIRTAADEIESQYRKLLAKAFCLGMDQLAQMDEETRVEQEEWKSYFLAYFDQFGDNEITAYARGYAEEKVEELVTAMNFAEVSPRVAQAYVQHCVRVAP